MDCWIRNLLVNNLPLARFSSGRFVFPSIVSIARLDWYAFFKASVRRKSKIVSLETLLHARRNFQSNRI